MCPVEFFAALADWEKTETARQRFEMEKMRLQTLYLVNIQLDKHSKITDVRRLMPLPWDEFKIHIPTPEEWQEIDAINKKVLAKIKNKCN